MTDHHLIHWLHLKPAAAAFTISSVDALKVPALQEAEGGDLECHTDYVMLIISFKTDYK